MLSSLIYFGSTSTSAVKADTKSYTVLPIDKYPELRYEDLVSFEQSHPDIMDNQYGIKECIQKFKAIGCSNSDSLSVFRSINPLSDDTGFIRTLPAELKFEIFDRAVQGGTVFYRIGAHQWVVSPLTDVNPADVKEVGDLITFNSYEDSLDGMKKFLDEDIL